MTVSDVVTKAAALDPEGTGFLLDVAMYDMAREAAASVPNSAFVSLVDAARTEVAKAKAALVRSYVAKASSGEYPSADHVRTATWLAGMDDWLEDVSKATLWEMWNGKRGKERRKVNRDAFGRFTAISSSEVEVAGSREASFKVGRVGPARNLMTVDRGTVKPRDTVSEDERNRVKAFQGAYEQAVGEARRAKSALGSAAAQAQVTLRFANPQLQEEKIPLERLANPTSKENSEFLTEKLKSLDHQIVAMRIEPVDDKVSDEDRAKIARFDRLGVLGQLSEATFAQQGDQTRLGMMATSRQWNEPRTTVAMGRIGIAGDIMSAVAPNSKVARYARYIGAHGPEAYAALSPHLKRTAYRYRGTERRPSPEIRNTLEGDNKATVDELAAAVDSGKVSIKDAATQVKPARDAMGRRTEHDDPIMQSIRWRGLTGQAQSGDSLKMGVRSDAAAVKLLETLPRDALIGEVARRSGMGLPSQGVIIDRDGDVVSQSVGSANDHYLPFNLANLARLRGGQYVRTRVDGGLTGEDVFAAVFSGARSATVASSSGVFRLEFSPDFRGARSMSDRAGSMYDSYLEILNAIDEGDLYSKTLPQEVMDGIEEKLSSYDQSSEAYKTQKAKLEAEAKKEFLTVTAKDRKDLRAKARESVPVEGQSDDDDLTPEQKRVYDQLLYDLTEEKNSYVDLNGKGYETALRTLAAKYPYFIRSVEYIPLQGNPKVDESGGADFGRMGFLARMGRPTGSVRSSRSRDAGYIRPGQEPWRPRAAATEETTTTETAGGEKATTAGGTTQTTAQGGQKPAAAPATGSPAASAAAAKAALTEPSRKKVVDAVVNDFRTLVSAMPEVNANQAGEKAVNLSTDEFFGSDRTTPDVLNYLLVSPAGRWNDIFANPDHASKALSALSTTDSSTWKATLSNITDSAELDDKLKSGGLLGATTVDGLITEIRTRALGASDALMAGREFAPGANDVSVESSHSASALDYPEITGVADPEKFEKLLADVKVAPLLPMAERLGSADDGTALPMSEVSGRMKKVLDGLNEIRAKSQSVLTSSNQDKAYETFRDNSLKDFMAITGLSDDEVRKLMSSSGEVDRYNKQVQMSRTLLEVGRVYDLVKAGGAFPKASEAMVRVAAQKQPVSKQLSELDRILLARWSESQTPSLV